MHGLVFLQPDSAWHRLDEVDPQWPSSAALLQNGALDIVDASGYFYVAHGAATLETNHGTFRLATGMYGVATNGRLTIDDGLLLLAARQGYRAPLLLGGPLEATGRLRYIDGCTDTLLLAPWRKGDPCFNHLHIPAGTSQSSHVHPSLRIGIIAKGSGVCRTPQGESPLRPGTAFVLAPQQVHCFITHDASLDVVVFHPDSDTGPTDEDHPMLNRTWRTWRTTTEPSAC
ncbi:MAG TPA: AraC family ligand binding domain-containing protein [Kofleriaceae bacterium]|nr:AraC family ligand binding domain-containing protein [Kofleriaceae bacterium]